MGNNLGVRTSGQGKGKMDEVRKQNRRNFL